MLNRLLVEGRAGRDDVQAIIEKVARFHRSAISVQSDERSAGGYPPASDGELSGDAAIRRPDH